MDLVERAGVIASLSSRNCHTHPFTPLNCTAQSPGSSICDSHPSNPPSPPSHTHSPYPPTHSTIQSSQICHSRQRRQLRTPPTIPNPHTATPKKQVPNPSHTRSPPPPTAAFHPFLKTAFLAASTLSNISSFMPDERDDDSPPPCPTPSAEAAAAAPSLLPLPAESQMHGAISLCTKEDACTRGRRAEMESQTTTMSLDVALVAAAPGTWFIIPIQRPPFSPSLPQCSPLRVPPTPQNLFCHRRSSVERIFV